MQRPQQYFSQQCDLHAQAAGRNDGHVGKAHCFFVKLCDVRRFGKRPIGEEHVQTQLIRTVSQRGWSNASRLVREAYGLRWTALRYFNAAGADPDSELGEDHSPETHLIPLAIQTALGEKPALQIYGTDYPTPDGTAVRDYTHVMDLAGAHVAALRHMLRSQENAAITWHGKWTFGSRSGCSGRASEWTPSPDSRSAASRRRPACVGRAMFPGNGAAELVSAQSNLETIVRTALRWQESLMSSEVLSEPAGARTPDRRAAVTDLKRPG